VPSVTRPKATTTGDSSCTDSLMKNYGSPQMIAKRRESPPQPRQLTGNGLPQCRIAVEAERQSYQGSAQGSALEYPRGAGGSNAGDCARRRCCRKSGEMGSEIQPEFPARLPRRRCPFFSPSRGANRVSDSLRHVLSREAPVELRANCGRDPARRSCPPPPRLDFHSATMNRCDAVPREPPAPSRYQRRSPECRRPIASIITRPNGSRQRNRKQQSRGVCRKKFALLMLADFTDEFQMLLRQQRLYRGS